MITVSRPGKDEKAYGFYRDDSIKAFAEGACTGNVCDEFQVGGLGRYDRMASITVDQKTYDNLMEQIERWKSVQYENLTRDCTDFVTDVLRESGLSVPKDRLWPQDLGADYEGSFGRGGGRCLGPEALSETQLRYPGRRR